MSNIFTDAEDWVSNALSGKITDNQQQQQNNELYQQMIKAGATPEDAQAAVDEQNRFTAKYNGGTVQGVADAFSQLGSSPGVQGLSSTLQSVTKNLGVGLGDVIVILFLYLLIEHWPSSQTPPAARRGRK